MGDRKRKAEDGDDAGSGFIKAFVTESNGEISCSIEETNRIRALLGMKPLVVDTKGETSEAHAVRNFKQKQEDEARWAVYIYQANFEA